MYGRRTEQKKDHLAKQLFTPSPERRRKLRENGSVEPAHRVQRGRRRNGGFRMGVLGVLFFVFLCGLAVWVTVRLNRGWTEVTMEDVSVFFSNKPIRRQNDSDQSTVIRVGQPLFGWLGALPLAGIVGLICGIFTFLFMFYDSDIPGNFPPTPVSPRKRNESVFSPRWHLGYIFVPVNTLAAFSLALFYLRLHMALPLV